MNAQLYYRITGSALNLRNKLLCSAGLHTDEATDATVLVFDGDRAVATGSRSGAILKLIAVDEDYRGEDLTSTVISMLRTDALSDGHRHLFLYTKPECRETFSRLFFYPVASCNGVLLMEDRRDGIASYISSLPEQPSDGIFGAVIMNANPFTLGHLALVERAAGECDRVFVFVLSEDKSEFSAKDRFNMVNLGVSHLENVTVLPTGPYMISSATFPTYFIKDRENAEEIHCGLDIEIFATTVAKRLSITRRYVGTEPSSPTTAKYNEALKRLLPGRGISLIEVPRSESLGKPISAGEFRRRIKSGEREAALSLIPTSTINYLEANHLI